MNRQSGAKNLLRGMRCLLVAALLLAVVACRPFPTPSPTPTPRRDLATPTPTATWTFVPTPTPPPALATATFTPTGEVTATPPAAEPTVTPVPTQTPTPTDVPPPVEPTDTATVAPPAATVPPAATNTPWPLSTATPAPSLVVATRWRAEYYANPDLWGSPALVREDKVIGFDWLEGSPAPGLPADGFSVRWTGTATFEEGQYTFNAAMDDGMRVYVDDTLIVDEWRDRPARQVAASRYMSAGSHAVRVEYYERGHTALAKLWWEKERSFAGWKGMYWPNLSFLGNPALIRDDPEVSFDWLMDGPGGGMPVDRFSVRWTRALYLQEGSYRFRVQVDDGVRLWVDGQQLIDAWYDHSFHELAADHVIGGAGPHTIVVEYYDNTFEARIHVSWERRGDAAYAYWKGEYYGNKDLSGEPVLVRDDRTLSFDWDTAAPTANLPPDGFSARWTRIKEFEPGRYRFHIRADDGVRFYVDDTLVLDEWHSARDQTYEVDVDLPWKPKLRIEFYEDRGDARIKFEWERTGS